MTSVLKMTFTLSNNKSMTLNLVSPKEGLTKAAVEAAMQLVIDKQAFSLGGAFPVAVKSLVIRETNDVELA